MSNPGGNLKKPSLDLFNLRLGNLQPFDYTTEATFITHFGTTPPVVKKIPLDVAQDPGTLLQGLQFLNLTLATLPPVNAFNPAADSIAIRFKYGMSTKDNVPISNNGDYDPAKFSPIDFRINDTIRTSYTLSSYYAYDDGFAEYGAGLNQAGSYLAFKYLYKAAKPDTLIYVDIYFPQFGDNSTQNLQLEVRSNLSDAPSSILARQIIQVNRSTQNRFRRYKIDPAVIISNDFFVGWKQPSSASIPVGIDKNTDYGDKMYYNTTGTCIQNDLVKGSMMIRPGFGSPKGGGPVTGLEPGSRPVPIYPNPTAGLCYLPDGAENVSVIDMMGRALAVEIIEQPEATALQLVTRYTGLVLVRYIRNGKAYAEKVMVRAE